MKIVQINVTANEGGTGRVCAGISKLLDQAGVENYTLFTAGKSEKPSQIKYANEREIKLQVLKSRIFGNYGFNSRGMTKRLISHLEEIKPDIVHLHNLHGHNVNLEMLFGYFKRKPQIKLVWTFHDCWTFTGYCPYYELTSCDKWKSECKKCPQKRSFSWFFDKSTKLQAKKKELFEDLDITVTTPSNWLAEIVKQTYFSKNEIKVIHNGVDLKEFKPTESDFREKHRLQDKKIVLGVAANWGERKGVDVFIELANRFTSDYQIVLVGTNSKIDKILPSNIISIHRTENKKELAKIYTAADVFVNPTRDEVFGLVNIEALACGTPVITFNTGGSPECIDDTCGIVVDKNNIDAMEQAIKTICENQMFTRESCIERAKAFDEKKKIEEYIELYGNK